MRKVMEGASIMSRTKQVEHLWEFGRPGGNAYDEHGCRCDACREVKRFEQEEWAMRRPELRAKNPERASRSAATRCTCGGLLAENNAGFVYCLRCDR